MRKTLFLILSIVAISARAQFAAGDTTTIYTFNSETIIMSALTENYLLEDQIGDDTVWNFSTLDTLGDVTAIFYDDITSEISPSVNLVECRNGGLIVKYWTINDTAIYYRGELIKRPVSYSCDESLNNEFYGVIYGNTEIIPTPESVVLDEDEYDYKGIFHESGNEVTNNRTNYYGRGTKYILEKKVGTLITPFDTLNQVTMVLEMGHVAEYRNYYNDLVLEYDCFNAYWYHASRNKPIMTALQWRAPFNETEFLEVLTKIEFEKADLKTENTADPISESTCFVFPNPSSSGTLKHEFDDKDDIKVFSGNGQLLNFSCTETELILSPSVLGLVIVKGNCNGKSVAQKLIIQH